MDEGRKHDIAAIDKAAKSKDPVLRRIANDAGAKIKREQSNGYLRSAREALLNARKRNETGNVRQISEDIYKYTKHQKETPIGRSTFFFSLPWK